MAISVTDRPDILLYQPGKDFENSYPIGIWKASRQQSGDGTGGSFLWTVAPASALEASRYLWSLEEASAYVASLLGASDYPTLTISTGERYIDSAGSVSSISYGYTWGMQGGLGRNTGKYTIPFFQHCHIHQPGNGLTNAYQIILNNNNAILTSLAMWGYVWHPQARRVAGGPRRP